MASTKPSELESLLNEMKEQGFSGAVVRKDGVPIYSTLALNDVSANLMASVANVSDALLKRVDDAPENMELVFKNLIVVIVPVKNSLFCAVVNDRKHKSTVLDFAKKAEKYL